MSPRGESGDAKYFPAGRRRCGALLIIWTVGMVDTNVRKHGMNVMVNVPGFIVRIKNDQ